MSGERSRVDVVRAQVLAALRRSPADEATASTWGPRPSLRPITRMRAARRLRAALGRYKLVAEVELFAPEGDAGTIHLRIGTVQRRGGSSEWWAPTVAKTLGILAIRLAGGLEADAVDIHPRRRSRVARPAHPARRARESVESVSALRMRPYDHPRLRVRLGSWIHCTQAAPISHRVADKLAGHWRAHLPLHLDSGP